MHQSRGAFPHGGVTQSTEEFKRFVVKEFSKSSDAIEKKFTEFIFARYIITSLLCVEGLY